MSTTTSFRIYGHCFVLFFCRLFLIIVCSLVELKLLTTDVTKITKIAMVTIDFKNTDGKREHELAYFHVSSTLLAKFKLFTTNSPYLEQH